MDHHGHVLPRLHHLVTIAKAALAARPGERSIHPYGIPALQKIAAGEIGRRQVVVTGNSVERQPQPGRHMRHEARLAAARRPLEQQWQALTERVLEDLALVAGGLRSEEHTSELQSRV